MTDKNTDNVIPKREVVLLLEKHLPLKFCRLFPSVMVKLKLFLDDIKTYKHTGGKNEKKK